MKSSLRVVVATAVAVLSCHAEAASNPPVITIQGACGATPRNGTHGMDCKQTVTREDFESLLNALNPGGQEVSAEARRNLAAAYAQLMAFESAARKAGLEDTVQLRELVNWLRLRTVADLYRRSLQGKYGAPSQAEIAAYYSQHRDAFERVQLARILIPRENFPPSDAEAFEKKASAAAQIAHERAARQEDFDDIQKDVYRTLDIKNPPATHLGDFRRSSLQEIESAQVFSLKQGEVTPVETEPKNYVIYKVLGKDTLPEDQVKAEIARNISQEKLNHALQSALEAAHAQFDESYFGGSVTVPIPTTTPAVPTRAPDGH